MCYCFSKILGAKYYVIKKESIYLIINLFTKFFLRIYIGESNENFTHFY